MKTYCQRVRLPGRRSLCCSLLVYTVFSSLLLPLSGITGGWQPHCLTLLLVMEGNCLLKWLTLKWSGTLHSTQRCFWAEKELRHIGRSWPIPCDRLIHFPFTTKIWVKRPRAWNGAEVTPGGQSAAHLGHAQDCDKGARWTGQGKNPLRYHGTVEPCKPGGRKVNLHSQVFLLLYS